MSWGKVQLQKDPVALSNFVGDSVDDPVRLELITVEEGRVLVSACFEARPEVSYYPAHSSSAPSSSTRLRLGRKFEFGTTYSNPI